MKGNVQASGKADPLWPADDIITPPEEGKVRVWGCSLATDLHQSGISPDSLSSEELQRASRFHRDELRARFISSRVLLRSVLGRCLNIAPSAVNIGLEDRGKPHLNHHTQIQFNLAHSGDLMLLAVTNGMKIGVDVERVRPLNDAKAIARRFFSTNESNWLQRCSDQELDQAFFQLWTRKEAVLKATGEGISSGLDSLELLNPEGTFKPAVTRTADGGSETRWTFHDLHPAAGYIGALALPKMDGEVQIKCAWFQVD